ncbi:glycosyltransferase [Alkalihalobacterium chitinilyticum]|uniref:Glycosyltransferase n=1 Tax=Alkalihalobacterium chitinilyticum TaxID=2980103 RepID=A0ABT5VE97_9BACI|nr:glycosyltransferase [Alkalihalobacterium chitinilyticum]MDE5413783.1 glycosyltransferase [Alkalihalobacterium chitinilyticum]
MKPKVSIIMPVYNVESYLERCMASLQVQTLSDIEMIAVNDGSTDRSLDILNEYASKDQRIKVIDQENGGVSSARNAGLEAARGDYIGFVDPDDWIDKEMYEVLYETAVIESADIVMCSYIREFGSHSREKQFNLPAKVSYKGHEVQQNVMRRLVGPLNEEVANPELLDAWGTVWSKLYRAEIIKNNNITFTDLSVIGTNEDSLFNIQALYYANTFTFLNKPFYHYWRANETSVTTGYKPNLLKKWLQLYQIIEEFLKEKNMDAEFYKALNNRVGLNTLGLGLNELSKANKLSPIGKINKLNLILKNYRINCSLHEIELGQFPIVWRTFYLCAKLRFALGFYLMLSSIEVLRKVIR